MKLNRRDFLKGLGLVAGASALGGLPRMGFGGAGDTSRILVVLFLRGGCDGLSLFPPLSGQDRLEYEHARPGLKIPVASLLPLDGRFGLHPAAGALKPLYDQGLLAVVRAVGNLLHPSRSHFDAQAMLEDGTAAGSSGTGWLTRYFSSLTGLPPSIRIPSLAATSYTPSSLLGDASVLTLDDPNSFDPEQSVHWGWDQRLRQIHSGLFGGSDRASLAGRQALTAVEIIAQQDFAGYVPANGAVYPDVSLGNTAQMMAQIVKMNVGLRVAALEMEGWDTHNAQAKEASPTTGLFAEEQVAPLAQTLAALMADLNVAAPGGGTWRDRVTLVVQTEFGRRVRENAGLGTDHGYGADMLLLGGGVNGGRIYGNWPGLQHHQLFDGDDLMATTDFRRILSEVLIRRMENPNLGQIFPGYTGYTPLGVCQGTDLPPVYDFSGDAIFADGFED